MIRSEARIFPDAIQAHYGQRPLIYTSIDFQTDNELWRVGPYDFWLRSVAAHPDKLDGNRAWTFWQYSATGAVPGIPGGIDLNTFNGSTLHGRHGSPPTPAETGTAQAPHFLPSNIPGGAGGWPPAA